MEKTDLARQRRLPRTAWRKRPVCGPPSPDGFFKWQVAVSIALAAAILSGFSAINFRTYGLLLAGRHIWDPALGLDAAVPFLPVWVWAYCLYYPLSFAPLMLRAVREDRELFRRVVLAYLFQFGTAFLVFWFFPSHVVRPEVAVSGASTYAVNLLYHLDPGCNVFPSMHVCGMLYTALIFLRYRPGRSSALVAAAAASVIAATLFIKQHVLWDVAGGAALGLATFLFFHVQVPERFAPPVSPKLLQSPQ